jgi:phosphopantetheinyl transferase (holo-ACP synthase)
MDVPAHLVCTIDKVLGWTEIQLSVAEQAIADGFQVAKRRREWVAGRMVSKKLLISSGLLDDRYGDNLATDLSVLPRDDRSPAVYHESLTDELKVSLSISHRAGLVAAAVVRGSSAVGVDVERIDPRSPALLKHYLTKQEQEWMAGEQLLETVGWAAKEALYKATRGHRGGSPLDVVVGRTVGVGEDWELLKLQERHVPEPFSGTWMRSGRYVVVMVISPLL